jgi:hypothetical protein
MWRGNIDLSPVLGKHAAINYIAKYASKAESISGNLTQIMKDLARDQPDMDGIGTVIAKTWNRFCIERDFSAQEACHQLLQLQMVECSRVFETINLPSDLSVNRVVNPRRSRTRTRTRTAQPLQPNPAPNNATTNDATTNDSQTKSKLEGYMERHEGFEDLCYYDMVKKYLWRPKKKDWASRKSDAIVQVYPRNWQEALRVRHDPTRPHDGQHSSTFATAARRALMLHMPFRKLDRLSDINLLIDPTREPTWYDPAAPSVDNDHRWKQCFLWHMSCNTRRFPKSLVNLFYNIDITSEDFNVVVDPDNPDDTDDEWDPTPDIARRQEQEWETVARLPLNGQRQMGQPREYFGSRDIDHQHDWNSDWQHYQFVSEPETFIATQKRRNIAEGRGVDLVVLPEMLNVGQRNVYDYIVEGFRIGGDPQRLNSIVMGTAGVGKSFVIRALEQGLWQTAQEKYGAERYPTVRSVVRLAAFTGKAAYQVGGVTIHSLLKVGDIHHPQPLAPETLRRLQQDLGNIHFLFLDEKSMIGLKLLSVVDFRLRQI